MPRWTARYRQTGSVAPGKVVGNRPWLLATHQTLVLELVRKTSHLTFDLQMQLCEIGCQYAFVGLRFSGTITSNHIGRWIAVILARILIAASRLSEVLEPAADCSAGCFNTQRRT